MADTPDLGSGAARLGGSSPPSRTNTRSFPNTPTVDLSVIELSNVDREVTLTAGAEHVAPRVEAALKKIQKQAVIPGFRKGQAPLAVVKKRFTKDVEMDEINQIIQDVYRDRIVPAHKPIGEPRITRMSYEDGKLEVIFKLGIRPEFELVDLATVTVDKLVHDVADDEIDKEIAHTQRRKGTWSVSEGPVAADSKVVVDAAPAAHDGHAHDHHMDVDKELDLASPDHADVAPQLVGAAIGETRAVSFAHGDHSHEFMVTVKQVMCLTKPEVTSDYIKEVTNGDADDMDGYRAHLRSRIQDYYDKAAHDLYKENVADALVKAHTFDVPETIIEMLIGTYVEDLKKRNNGELPSGFDAESYAVVVRPRALNEAKWMFIQDKVMENYPDLEITKEDVDDYLASEAAKYGLPVDMIRNFYAQSGEQLENLRNTIRSQKLFDKLAQEVTPNPLSKDAYQKKHS